MIAEDIEQVTHVLLAVFGLLGGEAGGELAGGELAGDELAGDELALREQLQEVVNGVVLAQVLREQAENPLVRLRQHFRLDAVVQDCAGYRHWCGRRGQPPTYALVKLCWAVAYKHVLKLSVRGLAQALAENIVLRVCCGFGLWETPPHYSTLARFEAWLRQQEFAFFFVSTLQQIAADFPAEWRQVQYGDTFGMYSRCAEADRSDIVRLACRRLLQSLDERCPAAAAAVMTALETTPDVVTGRTGWTLLFGVAGERRENQLPALARDERECITARGAALCRDLVQVQLAQHGLRAEALTTGFGCLRPLPPAEVGSATAALQRPRRQNWLAVLVKLLDDEYLMPACTVVQDSDGTPHLAPPATAQRRRGQRRSSDGPKPYRIGTVKDLEATFRRHGKSTILGYNVALAATPNFVFSIVAYTGAQPDGEVPALLMAREVRQLGFAPAKLVFDAAAGDPKRIADVRAASQGRTHLVAPHKPVGRKAKRWGPEAFKLVDQVIAPADSPADNSPADNSPADNSPADNSPAVAVLVECPAGQRTAHVVQSSCRGSIYQFPLTACTGPAAAPQRCPLWDQCRDPQASPDQPRQVFISAFAYEQRQALAYVDTPEFKQDMHHRYIIERDVACLTRYNGARHADSYGLAPATYQVQMAATACNLKHWLVLTAPPPGHRRRATHAGPTLRCSSPGPSHRSCTAASTAASP